KLHVYYDGEKVCAIDEFSQYYPKTYNELLEKAYEAVLPTNQEVVKPVQEQLKKRVLQKDCAEYYINVLNELIIQIPKAEITHDLHQTTAMLKQIDLIEEKYPASKEKLVKLYQYYLPILVDILEGYVKLVNSNSIHTEIANVELKLRKTIVLVNEALKTITMQLCEEEIVDMKSDMSVLEAILRKDGLVKDGTLFAEEKSVK
ncbi:MAG: 5-bromo-4-chloroindolyl phosphate hydrolysis family protein, partial [Erysipelotrichales bacterium]|nr:5-bromo-4-chloroindolyl phosphate hydrolysis family protein [Erysipelotrichales bacterium]